VPLSNHLLVSEWIKDGDVAVDGYEKQMQNRSRAAGYIQSDIGFT